MERVSKKRSGAVLPLVSVAMVILLAIGVGVLAIGLQDRMQSLRDGNAIAAKCAADAGLMRQLYQINCDLRKNSDGSGLVDGHTEITGTLASGASFTADRDGTWNGTDPNYVITSTGTCNGVQRKESAVLGPLGVYMDGILVANVLDITNGANSTINGPCGTLSTASNAFDLGKAKLTGDPNKVITDKSKITGNTYALTTTIPIPLPVVPPLALNATNPHSTDPNYSLPSNTTLGSAGTTTYYKYTGLIINGTLNISGNVVLYVNGSINDQGSGIMVQAKSSLAVYVQGDIGPGSNNVDFASVDNNPAEIKIFGVSTSLQTFNLSKNNADMTATIYAPNAIVNLAKNMNSGSFDGSIVAYNLTSKKLRASNKKRVLLNDSSIF
jgi:hypothetical protein